MVVIRSGRGTEISSADFAARSASEAPRLTLRLLGRLSALGLAGEDLLPRVRKTRGLLALLAMADGEPILRQHLADLLWSTRDREQARGSLRQSVHELTEILAKLGPDIIVSERTHLRLRPDRVEMDVRAVWRATAEMPQGLEMLTAGPFLEDLIGLDPAFDGWVLAERAKLAERAARVAEAILAALAAERAAPREIIAAAERLLSIDPTRESGWRAIMTAHMDLGERASAIGAFERCSAILAERARSSPSDETRALHETIRGGREQPARAVQVVSATISGTRGVRVGVLPFRVISHADEDGLSIGLSDEITNALARFRWIFLIASPSLAALGSTLLNGQLQSLGLDFLLEGTVQRAGSRIRATVRLLDMHGKQPLGVGGGEVVWVGRFERTDGDLFQLQDDVAAETVARIDPELLLREAHRAAARRPSDPTAYELMLRAIPGLYRVEKESFHAAGALLEAAIARDRDYAPATAWLAYWHVFLVGQGWAPDVAASMGAAGELAERAVALDGADARALTIAGHVRSFLRHQHADAIILHDRALALNPNLPLAWAFSGLSRAYIGAHEEAIRHIGEARRLSPFDPHCFFFETAMMVPTLLLGDFERVVELGRRAVHLNPALSSTLKGYLSALGHLGLSGEISAVRTRLLQLEPGFSVERALLRSPFQRDADRALYAEGLRKAGLPETAHADAAAGGGGMPEVATDAFVG